MAVKKAKKKVEDPVLEKGFETGEEEFEAPQSLNQQKIALANSPMAAVMLELVKDVLKKVPLVGNDQWETVKNAVIIDTSSEILKDLVDHLEGIRRGSLAGK